MAQTSWEKEKYEFPWSVGVFDAHCHPTDTMSTVPDISKMKAKSLVIMATRKQDQQLVSDVAKDQGIQTGDLPIDISGDWRGIVPSFGWHPWFSHQIYNDEDADKQSTESTTPLDMYGKAAHYQNVLVPKPDDRDFLDALPDPIPLSQLLNQVKQNLQEYPTALVGEIGLDKAFRIPDAWLPGQVKQRDASLTPGGREGRHLSPYRVSMDHQRKVLLAQLKLAGEMQRAVSVHGVQAHGVLFETLEMSWKGQENIHPSKREKKRAKIRDQSSAGEGEDTSESAQKSRSQFPPRICLHSYSGPPDTLKLYLRDTVPAEIYFSFSTAINFSTSAQSKTEDVIKVVPDDRILIESDLHTAGADMDRVLEAVTRKICTLKAWELSAGVTQLATNWKHFVFGKT